MVEGEGGVCLVCGRRGARPEIRTVASLSVGVASRLRQDFPDARAEDSICRADHARYRRLHVERLLEAERGELSTLDQEVLASLEAGATVSEDVEAVYAEKRSFGERSADAVATFGGSWTFIMSFCFFLFCWMLLNVTGIVFAVFDPFPFILLNLLLSCIAALQAPIIMMSQRRQEAKDRLRAENDYKVNLKAELEIRHLHDKIDHQLARQWERLVEIQQIQIEMLEEATDSRRG